MKSYLLTGWFIVYSLFVFSALRHTNIEVLTAQDGLANNTVYCIHQDKDGFMWFGTDLGISRYDDQRFHNFLLNNTASSIKQFFEGPDGFFWLLGTDGELRCFDRYEEQTLPVTFIGSDSLLNFNRIQMVNDSLLCGVNRYGLFRLHVSHKKSEHKKQVFIRIEKESNLKGSFSMICLDEKKERIYTIIEKSPRILEYDLHSRTGRILDISSLCQESPDSKIYDLRIFDNHLWILREWAGVICYDLQTDNARSLEKKSGPDQQLLHNLYVRDVIRQNDSTYYLATLTALCRLCFSEKPGKGKFTTDYLPSISNDSPPIMETRMLSEYYDPKLKLLWVGTFGGGIIKFDLNDIFYNQIYLDNKMQLKNIAEDDKGYIWLTTNKRGIWKSNLNIVNQQTTFSPWLKAGSPTGKYVLYKDRNGDFWLGDEENNVIRIDPETEASQTFQLTPKGIPNFFSKINGFCLDSKEQLWIATEKGIILYNTKSKEMTCLLSENFQSKGINAITEDKKGNIWIGTEQGLMRLEYSKDGVKLIGGYEKQAGLKPSLVYSLFVNKQDQLLASYADKVLRIDSKQKDKVDAAVSLGKGLANGQIYCMTDDHMGNTWLGSNSGILTVKSGEISFYNYSFSGNNNAVCHLHDKRLLWTNSWGIMYFDPASIKKRCQSKQLFIADVAVHHKYIRTNEKVNGQVILQQSANKTDELTFNCQNNNFTIYFTSLQYSPVQQKIAFRLTPHMKEWATTTLGKGISFNRLKAGDYKLQVRSIFYDDTQGDIKQIAIHILPHWTNTIWMHIFYFLLSILIILLIRHWLIRRFENNEKQRIQDIKLKEELFQAHMQLAYRTTIGMQNTCNQLFDLYRHECLSDHLQVGEWNIMKLTDALTCSLKELLETYQINFQHIRKTDQEISLWVDKQKIEFILRNLLLNAIRHTSYSGTIQLEIREEYIDNIRWCVLSVADDGKEIVKENMNELFAAGIVSDKELDLSKLELGFQLFKKIVELHHGKIAFHSQKEKEVTRISLYIPFGKDHLSEDSNVTLIDASSEPENFADRSFLPMTDIDGPGNATEHKIEGAKKKLLIIDNTSDIHSLLYLLFFSAYNIIQAEDGQQGIDLALQEHPDIILCSIRIPVKNGYECCKEIKEHPQTCHIPIILLNEKAKAEDVIKGTEAGADDYLLTPFNPEVLKAKVYNLVKNRSGLRQMYARQSIQYSGEKAELKNDFIISVVKVIKSNIRESDFNVKKLAETLNMSQPTLYRKVKQNTDLTIIELIRRVRLEQAALLLKEQRYTVQEVAEMVGYNDIPTFRKNFTEYFGITPSVYAKT